MLCFSALSHMLLLHIVTVLLTAADISLMLPLLLFAAARDYFFRAC